MTRNGGDGNDTRYAEGYYGFLGIWFNDYSDRVHGRGGNDKIHGGDRADTLWGGDGFDTLWGGDGNDYIVGGNGGPSSDNLNDGDDSMMGGNGNDSLFGNNGNDRMWGNNGSDELNGNDGNDYMVGGNGGPISDNLNDGNDKMWGGNGNDSLFGNNGNDSLWGNNDNDELNGNDGNDELNGGNGNDELNGGNGNDTLSGDSGNDIMYGGSGDDRVWGNSGDDNMWGESGNDQMDGDSGNDYMVAGSGNDTMWGSSGSDTLYGGNDNDYMVGDEGAEKTTDGNDQMFGGFGNDSMWGNSGNDSLAGDSGSDQMVGGNGDDTLDGGWGADSLWGGSGNDVLVARGSGNFTLNSSSLTIGLETDQFWEFETVLLKGSYGNDHFTNNGFTGSTAVAYNGKAEDFEVTRNNDRTWTVKDINISDGNEGTDTLINIDQIFFEYDNTRIGGDLKRNTVSAVAGVHNSNANTSHSISGGNSKATNFVIDIEGETGFGLDFDTSKLANFINDITLPDQGIEDARLRDNLILEIAAGAQSAIPIFGAIGSTHTAYQQTLLNYDYDLQQVDAQKQAAIDAVNNPNYNTSAWATINQTFRDLVVIEDFQIGVDNLFLPSPSANVGYALKTGTYNGDSGVWIEAQINNENTNLAFIVNNYDNKSKIEFHEEITNLLKDAGNTTTNQDGEVTTSFNGPAITTFNQTPIVVAPLPNETAEGYGTYANDWIKGDDLNHEPAKNTPGGSFTLIGEFGDDFLQGGQENDYLYGGFTGTTPTFDAFTYEDDGFDMLQGGKGDDDLKGGTGNDILDGGGLIYDKNNNGNVTGVITNDGTDTLTGGLGNDTFVFNTLSTGIDTITDFTVLIDKIQINQAEFGATSNTQFSFDDTNGALSFNDQQFATLANYATLDGFDVSRDIELV